MCKTHLFSNHDSIDIVNNLDTIIWLDTKIWTLVQHPNENISLDSKHYPIEDIYNSLHFMISFGLTLSEIPNVDFPHPST